MFSSSFLPILSSLHALTAPPSFLDSLNRLRALKTRQIKEERLAAQMEKGWEGRAGGLEIRLPPADGATGASGGARSRHAMTGGDTADDMVAMQRRAAREGVNPEFTESPLFPRPKR